MINLKGYSKVIFALLLIAVFAFGLGSGYFYFKNQELKHFFQKDIYAEFVAEAYNTIKENYWEKISDEQLTELFKLGTEKLSSAPQVLETTDLKGAQEMVWRAIKNLNESEKKDFVTNLVNIVLVNLKPFGRSQLFTQEQETQLRETVKNIDQTTDLYQVLGVAKNASREEINQTYQEKKNSFSSPEKSGELAQLNRAFEALSEPETRAAYDQSRVEPTVITNLITPDILHLKLTKLSPQSFEEFQKKTADIDKNYNPTALILDLRGNIGGAIDLLQYFLGPFIGQNQLAYEFFHQEQYQPFKTQTGWLASLIRYKKVVILIDDQTQSSAEVAAAVLKKYNVGVLVGVATKGWGTVENTFPLKQTLDSSEKYSILLVHSLTLREDNQPIEGRGVDPAININDSDWQQQLWQHFNYQPLITAVAELVKK